jgi:aldose 1-epimerase
MIVTLGDEVNGLAVDTAAGGRICSLTLRGRERILSLPAAGVEPSIAWGCYLMAPFVGRTKGGSLTWAGRTVKLRLNDNRRHSIHGAAFDSAWTIAERSENSVTMTCEFDEARWPFRGSMVQRITMSANRLTLEAEILAGEDMPAAIGWHPWFHTEDGPLSVQVPSDAVLKLGSDLIPTGGTLPVDERTDLRSGPSMEGRRLDDVFTGVRAPVSIVWPDLELTMRPNDRVGTYVVFTHRQAVCVEPMTAWPDAVRLSQAGCADTGLASLSAGQTLTVSTEWSWRPRSAR